MVKPEWGVKRICHSCSAPFYDLRRDPITCPKCGSQYDPEAILKSRRSRTPVAVEKETAPIILDEEAGTEAPEVVEEAEEVEEEEEEVAAKATEGDEDEEEEEDTIEDASELGEDEDDMAEVIENIEEEDER
jgi:uncharacterized protein (TIGR02300 family)